MTQTNIKEPNQSNMSVFGTIPEDEFVLYGTVKHNPLRACKVTNRIAL